MTPRRTRTPRRRGAALYMLVVGCAATISLLGLAGLTLARLKNREGAVSDDAMVARWNARSAVHVALSKLAADSSWRSNVGSRAVSSPASLGGAEAGKVSWMISDTDGSLTNVDKLLRVTGIGESGHAKQAGSIQVTGSEITGPTLLKAMTSSNSTSNDKLRNDKWWGQYVQPTLPSATVEWWITSFELYCKCKEPNRSFRLQICQPTAGKNPSSLVLDGVTINSSSVPTNWNWHSVAFPSGTRLTPGKGVCITLTTSSTLEPLVFEYRTGGVSDASSAVLLGDESGWGPPAADKSLRYKLNGCYTVLKSDLTVVAGSWTWDAAP